MLSWCYLLHLARLYLGENLVRTGSEDKLNAGCGKFPQDEITTATSFLLQAKASREQGYVYLLEQDHVSREQAHVFTRPFSLIYKVLRLIASTISCMTLCPIFDSGQNVAGTWKAPLYTCNSVGTFDE